MRLSFARYTQSFTKPTVVAAETLLVPALAVALGIWLNPLDPLCVNSSFPWLWLAPLVLALRYGPLPGLVGAAILLAAWAAFREAGWIGGDLPKIHFLGGLVTVMLTGEFSSLWLARARRAESMQQYLDQRLEQLTEHYYLLRLSHDRLEQDLIGRPLALRDALQALRDLPGGSGPLPGAAELLQLLAQYCQLEVAAIHPFVDGRPDPAPAGRLGAEFLLKPDDALVRYALENNALAHLQTEVPNAAISSEYVVVAPIGTADQAPVGLLVVHNLPFFALNDDTLQTLNLMLGYYADGLLARPLLQPILNEFSCPPEFAFELMRAWHIHQNVGMGSTIVALEFHARQGFEDLPNQVLRQQRSLDVSWMLSWQDTSLLVTLMPLSGTSAAEGYIARIEEWVQLQRGVDLAAAGVFAHVHEVGAVAPQPLLKQLLSASNVPDQAWAVRSHG